MKSRLFYFAIIILGFYLSLTTSCTSNQYLPEEEPVIVDTVSFANDIMPIFNEGCNTLGCHNTGGIAPDLSPGIAYDALFDGGFIDVNVPENSELLAWMRGERDLDMPLDGPNVEWNATILAWITQGALNN